MAGRIGPRLLAATAGLLATLALGTATAAAAPGVIQDLPGCRTNQLAANDDSSTAVVPLGFSATIFDRSFEGAYLNNNGNITFDDALNDFTPFDFRETGAPFIAPFFADVDTQGGGSGLMNYGQVADYGGHKAFCVIWDHVGYYRGHADKTNTFQAILVDQGDAGMDVVFNYSNIAWETGDASGGSSGFGGSSAAAGYSAGDGDSAHALILPGSFTNGGLLDTSATSLAGHATAGQPAGRYVFALRIGALTGGRMVGQVRDPDGDGVTGAVVQICPEGGGACITRIADTDGNYRASNLPPNADYRVTGFTGPDDEFSSTTIDNVPIGAIGSTRTRNIVLGAAPAAPPEGTTGCRRPTGPIR
jgi:Nidogen-like/Carboxypeptidase regulatory-like domain